MQEAVLSSRKIFHDPFLSDCSYLHVAHSVSQYLIRDGKIIEIIAIYHSVIGKIAEIRSHEPEVPPSRDQRLAAIKA